MAVPVCALVAVPSGVVQGSCIGPCGFTNFINNLRGVIQHAKSSLYTDDQG